MKKVVNMTFASSLTELCEVNPSFDTGILRICYTGENRNKTSISKQAIERSIKTLYNCPIVCNYDRETDSLGGHDIELVSDKDGDLHVINVTQPVGVIPESSRVWFDTFEEEDGTVNEYLYAEVLLWKRQEAYKKIKEDGIVAHSMEITVNDGEVKDGIFDIKDFTFTAFALIGVEPCFESSALQVFSKTNFKQQFSEMMLELKEVANKVTTSKEDDNKHPQNFSTEGGEKVLEEKISLAAEYGIDVESLDFSLEDFSIEELKEKFEAMKNEPAEEPVEEPAGDPVEEHDEESTDEAAEEPDEAQSFALTGAILDEINRQLEEIKIEKEWGEVSRYWYYDSDFDTKEVYCWDVEDWILYGFSYEVQGDSVVIDFDSKKRKKVVLADFEEGEKEPDASPVFTHIEQAFKENTELEAKYHDASEKISSMEEELNSLREFKAEAEAAKRKEEVDSIFERFNDLAGIEAFETLKNDHEGMDNQTLEEKCFAIRGMNVKVEKFSLNEGKTKIKVEKSAMQADSEPYGGVFVKYGLTK